MHKLENGLIITHSVYSAPQSKTNYSSKFHQHFTKI